MPRPPSESQLLETFLNVSAYALIGSLILLAAYPIGASIQYLYESLNGFRGLNPDFLDAGAHQPMGQVVFRSLTCFALVSWLVQPRPPERWSFGHYLMLALALLIVASAAFSRAPGDAWPESLNTVLYLALFAVALETLRSRDMFDTGLRLLVTTAVVVASSGLYDYIDKPLQDGVTGAFHQQNVLAGYLALLIPPAVALFLTSRGLRMVWWGLGASVLVGSVLLTFSRAGWASVGLSLAAFLILAAVRRYRVPLVRVLAVAALAWTIFAVAGAISAQAPIQIVPSRALERARNLASEEAPSLVARLAFFKAAAQIGLDHPLFGTGLNTFGRYYTRYQTDFRWYSRYSHSLYFDILSELGIPALLLFLLLIAWILKQGWAQTAPVEGDEVPLLRLAILCGLLGSLLHSAADVDWKFSIVPVTFFLLAALAMAPHDAEPEEHAEELEPAESGVRPAMMLQFGAAALCMVVIVLSFRQWQADGWWLVASRYMNNGEAPKALQCIEEAIPLFPWKSEYYQVAADACFTLYRTRQGEAYLERAAGYCQRLTAVDPDRAVGWDRLGQVLFDQGRVAEAEPAWRRALQLDPNNFPQFYVHLAQALVAQGRKPEAKAVLEDALPRFPEDKIRQMTSFRQTPMLAMLSDLLALYADMRQDEGKAAEAQRLYEASLRLNPKQVRAFVGLGFLHLHGGRGAEARPWFEKAIEEKVRDVAVYQALRQIMMEQKDTAGLEWLKSKATANGVTL